MLEQNQKKIGITENSQEVTFKKKRIIRHKHNKSKIKDGSIIKNTMIDKNKIINKSNFLHYDLLRYFNEKDDNYWHKYMDYSLLGIAIQEQDIDLVGYLLARGFNPNIVSDSKNGYYPIEQVIINIAQNPDDFRKINKYYKILELLLSMHADVNLYKESQPLLTAVSIKLCGIINLFLKYGADPYSGMILCISKLLHANLNKSEFNLWKKIGDVFRKYYRVLFNAMVYHLSHNYNYLPPESIENTGNIDRIGSPGIIGSPVSIGSPGVMGSPVIISSPVSIGSNHEMGFSNRSLFVIFPIVTEPLASDHQHNFTVLWDRTHVVNIMPFKLEENHNKDECNSRFVYKFT